MDRAAPTASINAPIPTRPPSIGMNPMMPRSSTPIAIFPRGFAPSAEDDFRTRVPNHSVTPV
ncbi:MAG: hypothetical protein Q7I94_03915 [Candidatus Contubernalis sp.]|nr:hypothetical protein [Candidatus Contubernalis sp.]